MEVLLSRDVLTVRDLAVIGEAMFGRRWRTDVANALGVSYRAVARWSADGRIPDASAVRDRLRVVVRERLEGLEKARSVLWRKAS